MNHLSSQVVVGALLAYFAQWLKTSKYFPWITAETTKINRVVAVVVAGIATLGIHIVCSKVDHQCTLTWVDGMTIASGLWHWLSQVVFMHGWLKVASKEQ